MYTAYSRNGDWLGDHLCTHVNNTIYEHSENRSLKSKPSGPDCENEGYVRIERYHLHSLLDYLLTVNFKITDNLVSLPSHCRDFKF